MDALSKVFILIAIAVVLCLIPLYFKKDGIERHYAIMKETFPPPLRLVPKKIYITTIKITIIAVLLFLVIAFVL